MKQLLFLICSFFALATNGQSLIGKWRLEKFSGDTAVIGNIQRLAISDNGVDYSIIYSCKSLFRSNFRSLQRSLTDKTRTYTLNFISEREFTLPHEDNDKGATNIDTYAYSTLDGVMNIGNGYHRYESGGKWYTREYRHDDLINYNLTATKLVFTIQCGESKLNLHFKKVIK